MVAEAQGAWPFGTADTVGLRAEFDVPKLPGLLLSNVAAGVELIQQFGESVRNPLFDHVVIHGPEFLTDLRLNAASEFGAGSFARWGSSFFNWQSRPGFPVIHEISFKYRLAKCVVSLRITKQNA